MKRIVIAMLIMAFFSASAATSASAQTQCTQQTVKKAEVQTVVFSTNLNCENCVKKVNANLSVAKGVKSLDVSLKNQKITVGYDPAKTDEKSLAAQINKLGYKAEKTAAQAAPKK